MDDFKTIDLFDEGEKVVDNDFSDIGSDEGPVDEQSVSKDEDNSCADVEVEPEIVESVTKEDAKQVEDTDCAKTPEPTPIISEKLDKLLENNGVLSEQLSQLLDLFNKRIMHTNHEEKIVDNMHSELQKYKEDMYAQLIRPILLDIIDVRDSIMRISATYLAKPEGEQRIPNKTFSDYAFDLQDILEKNNVEIYRSNSGDVFVPIKQRVIKKVATGEQELHGKVAESLSCGYIYNGRTISAEKIAVYFYDESLNINKESEAENNG